MALTLAQRLDRINVRLAELPYWRDRESVAVEGWTFDGQPIAPGDFWPDRDGVHRFNAEAEVPAHWPLGEARLQLDIGGESLLTLRWDGGEQSFGLDPYHREFPLKAQRFSIETESVARRPFGEPVREPRLTTARLIWLDQPVHALHLRLKQIVEAGRVLGDHDVVAHLVAAAETAFHALDWPSATEDYIARFAPEPGQQRIWQLPTLKENPAGLDDTQRQSVIDADAGLVEALRALQQRFPPQGAIALTGHAHIDLAWLWPYSETRRKARRTFHTALSLMEGSNEYLANSGFVFNQSTAHYYAQVEEDDPELFEKIVQAAKDGSWEPVGGLWIEPDTNMPAGESLTRQVLYGQRYFEQKFGRRHTVCWLPDCFGFSGALPQLLKQAGIDSFFTIKVNWSETNKFPADLFWWEGIDGSRVLAHTFENPRGGYNGQLGPEAYLRTWQNFKNKALHDETLLAIGYGDGGGGVTPEFIEREMQLRDFPALPKARWGRVGDFFARAHEGAAKTTLPVWSGDIYLELHRSTLTTQSAVKDLHRRAERALIVAETIGSVATLLGANAPPSLEPHWRTVLKNEFHDILPGSSIAEVYADASKELGGSLSAGQDEQQSALERITAALGVSEPEDGRWMVFNPSLSPRQWVAADGRSVVEVPPLSVVVPAVQLADEQLTTFASPYTLENAQLRITLGGDGTIASMQHKESGREALAGRGNQLWVYPADKTRNWDAWDLEDDYARSGIELIEVTDVVPHSNGNGITFVKQHRNTRITVSYMLGTQGRRLDIEVRITVRDRHCLLRTLTPVAVRTTHATFEHANGVVRRSTHHNTSWDQAQFEVPAHRFADMSEPGFGVGLLNGGKYGHSAKDNVLGLSLVRSPVYPDPLADEGPHLIRYALHPHAGDWHEGGVREEAEDLNQPLVTMWRTGLSPGIYQPITVSGIPVALSGLKPAEDGDGLIFRVYEPAGGRGQFDFTLPEGWRNAGTVSILEEPMETPDMLMPFEVRSWRLVKG